MLSRLRARHGRNAQLLASKPSQKKRAKSNKLSVDNDDSDYHEPVRARDRSPSCSDFESDSAIRKRLKQNRKRKMLKSNDPELEPIVPDEKQFVVEKTPKRRKPLAKKSKKTDNDAITLEQLQKAFHLLDRDLKGILTRKDLQSAMAEIGGDPLADHDAIEMLLEADRRGDGNGSVNVSDFLKMMESVFPRAFQPST